MRPQPLIAFPVWKARTFEPDPRLCFVIMPFGKQHLDRAFQKVVVAVGGDLGLVVERADHGPEEIMEGIWKRMLSARVVIADVTDENPNVMYELGMAHVLGKPVLLMSAAAGSDEIAFDLRRYRHIFYKSSPQGLDRLRADLARELRVLLDQSPTGSHLLDELEAYAKEWSQRNHDSFSLHPEVVNRTRLHLDPAMLSDLAIAYCTATGAHYNSVDHMVYWGRACAARLESAAEIAMTVLPGKPRRPAWRTARLIEQFSPPAHRLALERMIEHGVSRDLLEAVEKGQVQQLLREHGSALGLLAEEIATLLQQLPNIQIRT